MNHSTRVFLLLLGFCLFTSSLFASEVIAVRVVELDLWRPSGPLELVSDPMTYVKGDGYLATVKLPTKDWQAPKDSWVSVYISLVQSKAIRAKVKSCNQTQCSLKIYYPYRGLENQRAKVEWNSFPTSMVQIPVSAVISPTGKKRWVYIVENGFAKKRLIQTLPSIRFPGVILEGLKQGDQIVISGYERLIENQKVEVIK